METEDLARNQCGHGQEVKETSELEPNIGRAVFAKTFIIKSIHLSDLTRFVIASQNCDAIRVSDL